MPAASPRPSRPPWRCTRRPCGARSPTTAWRASRRSWSCRATNCATSPALAWSTFTRSKPWPRCSSACADPFQPPQEANVSQDQEIPKGYWKAADGSLMPISKISDLDKARDEVVRRLMSGAEVLSRDLAEFKRLAMSEVEQFVSMSALQYGHVFRGVGGKGNVTLTSYD
ncbi:MAG: DUF3164 family protein, partial [Roseateles sp.]